MDPPQVQLPGSETPSKQNPSNEVEMTDSNDAPVSVPAPAPTDQIAETQSQEQSQGQTTEDTTLVDAQPEPEAPAPAKKNAGSNFLDFLTSPIVEIAIGKDESSQTILTAHQTLLIESPFLSEFVNKFEASGPRRITLPEENVEAFGCFLQFQYTHDYTVTQTPPTESTDLTKSDNTGDLLLRHARVYTLAEKLGMPSLKRLAHTKIHQVNGTPSGELAYARYVYTNTPEDDTTIRKPVASYWAARSHTLRHGIEEEWRKICLDIPEFSYDVLTIVLNKREKGQGQGQGQGQTDVESTPTGRGRGAKRLRSEK